ncbi:hypothetical protein DMC47_13920 [Nostoc sp. 3335mG]|nr:hypothetical protein DMC47_13920 [Nostoc sp. 3335mG]
MKSICWTNGSPVRYLFIVAAKTRPTRRSPLGTRQTLEIEMALSLPGERSVAAAMPTNPSRAPFVWVARIFADRNRRNVLRSLLELDDSRLHDLGISHADIRDAMAARNARAASMVLTTARSRQARL